MIRFVALDDTGLPTKRKYAPQACELCRRKKKRCVHSESVENDDKAAADSVSRRGSLSARKSPNAKSMSGTAPQSLPGKSDPETDEAARPVDANPLESSSSFVCDLNPESVFIQATSPDTATVPSFPSTSQVGIWRPRASQPTAKRARSDDTAGRRAAPKSSQQSGGVGAPSEAYFLFERARQNYLETECLPVLPPEEDFKALKSIFVDKIHPIYPVFKDSDLEDDSQSVYCRLTKQIVALAAAPDVDAVKHLRLRAKGPVLEFREFHRRVSAAVFAVLDARMVENRLDLIRILTMLSLFYQPATTSERDRAALLCSEALHHFVTIGAHLAGYRPQTASEDSEKLFCAIWALDTIVGAFYSKPRSFHERDSDLSLDECIAKQPPAFRLFLTLIKYLDRIVDLYRPHQKFQLIDIPVFEMMALGAGAGKLPTVLLATLEILYHAVSVLSCRQLASAFSDNPAANDFSYIPHPLINPRRSVSADRIVWITQNQAICPFLFVPYAVSLALTVKYRKMRYSQIAMFRNRGRAEFKEIIGVLKRMGETYITARVNAGLGESILKQMEKTACSLVHDEADKTAPVNKRAAVATPAQTSDTSVPVLVSDSGTASLTPATTEDHDLQAILGAESVSLEAPVLDNLDLDVDLFGYFDPSFNLDAIDTALEANLEVGIPQDWTIPWEDINA
ncbi:hypothetical protein GQ53DRAFT_795467 [Thozetella sp. PMI_491]|nr:hypothetical protein GQ53DRAFT_795467 [Thozetella sp. PMI_491]